MRLSSRALGLCLVFASAACGQRASSPPPPAAGAGDAAFATLATDVLEDTYRRLPTQATYLGIHKYDDALENYSRQGVTDQLEAARRLHAEVAAIDPASLSADRQLDREQILHSLDSRILTL